MSAVVQLPPELIATSPGVDWLDGMTVRVVHLGQHAAVLQPADGQELLVCTDRTRGLVPGGVSMSMAGWRHLRHALAAAGDQVTLVTAPGTRLSRHSLVLGARSHPGALRAVLATAGAGEPPPVGLHPLADPTSRNLPATLHELVGWGRGATPAGDDILVGALAAHLIAGRPDAHGTLARQLRPLLSRTTRMSRQDLRAACAGQFCERLHRLLNASAAQNHKRARRLVDDWGASSGHDVVTGLLACLPIDHAKNPRRQQ